FRMPVHANDLADPVGVNLEALTIQTDAVDFAVPLRGHTDVAGNPDLEIELLVRSDREVLPAVWLVLWQVGQNDGRFRWIVEVVFDVVDLLNRVKLGDVERALVQSDAVGPMQTRGNDLELALGVLGDDCMHLILQAARNKHAALITEP